MPKIVVLSPSMDEARPTDRERSLEPRATDLHVQIEQVSVALQQLRHTQQSLNTIEVRLSEMTRDCAAILDGWAKNDEKHATAVVELHSRLSEWNEIERRLLNESTTRIHQFERSLQHEWTAIRQAHEEPIRQLDAQTTRVVDACLTAVDRALHRFDAAEARLASLEEGLHREIESLTREVREAVTDLRHGAQPQIAARQPWSIDNVVRLHGELRGEGDAAPGPALVGAGSTLGVATPAARGSLALAGPTPVEAGPGRTAPAAPAHESGAASAPAARVWRPAPVVAAAAVVLLLGAFGVYLQWQVRSGLRDAAARAEAAERSATEVRAQARQELDAVQKAAEQRLEAAQEVARSAQTLATIAAASDLRRFALFSRDRTVVAQALVSRMLGIVLSAPNLPTPPAGRAYQLWLISPERATSVGLISAGGRASLTFPTPSPLPSPVVRVSITLEPASGSTSPTSAAYLLSPETQ
jgi:Anti-sigma-K factor rskA